jgi:hypothetical protein
MIVFGNPDVREARIERIKAKLSEKSLRLANPEGWLLGLAEICPYFMYLSHSAAVRAIRKNKFVAKKIGGLWVANTGWQIQA